MGIKMKGLKKVLTGALALTMCLGTALTTMAGTGGTVASPAKAELTKTVSYANGLTTPEATFTFEFAKTSKDGIATDEMKAKMPTITNATIGFTAGETGTTVGGVTKVTKSTADLLASIDWAAADGAGTYVWTVSEQGTGFTAANGESMDYSQASFKLVVKVAYDAGTNSYYVESTHTDQVKDDANGDKTGKSGAETGDAGYNFTFTNIYNKQGGGNPGGGEGDNEALAISKAVVNSVNPNKDFTFSLTLDDSAAKQTPGTYEGTVYNGTTATTTKHSVTAGTAATFTLKEGQRLVFHDVPVGAVVNVTESGELGYTPAISGMVTVNTGTEGGSLATGNAVVTAGENQIIFTNTYNSGTIETGVLANNLPFIFLIGAGILAVALFAVINKRKAMQ